MKKKALVLVLVCILGMALSVSGALAAAGPPWYSCTITAINVVGSTTTLVLSNPAFPTTSYGTNTSYYVIDPANPRVNTMVAMALTSYSLTAPVMAFIVDPATAGSVILYMGAGTF